MSQSVPFEVCNNRRDQGALPSVLLCSAIIPLVAAKQ